MKQHIKELLQDRVDVDTNKGIPFKNYNSAVKFVKYVIENNILSNARISQFFCDMGYDDRIDKRGVDEQSVIVQFDCSHKSKIFPKLVTAINKFSKDIL